MSELRDLARLFSCLLIDEQAREIPALTFCVWGKPETAGSKRALPRKGTPGRFVVVDDNPRSRDWKKIVAAVASNVRVVTAYPLQTGPLGVRIVFRLTRPRYHYTSKGRLKEEYRTCYPIVRPDATKLLRAVEDALTGVLWEDDAQVVRQIVEKDWAREGEPPGVEITIWPRTREEPGGLR